MGLDRWFEVDLFPSYPMKQKSGFVKAGPTTINVVYPSGFRELCRYFDIVPGNAIQRLASELCICGVHFSANSESQALAGLLFGLMVGRGSMPDEPSSLKREIAAPFLLQLLEVHEQIQDTQKLQLVRAEIIKKWYQNYKKALR